MKKVILSAFILCGSLLQVVAQNPQAYKNGVIVSAHPEASRVGVDILKKGGNAVDAAVAVELALAVVYPNAGNIGGGGFMVYRGHDGKIDALDYREKAPMQARENMYWGGDGEAITELSMKGALASGVPGTIDGMIKAHAKYGSLPWEELVQPAIDLAEKGFNITEKQAGEFAKYHSDFVKYSTQGTALTAKEQWVKEELFIQPDLAETLKRVQKEGRKGFYEGKTAELIVGEMQRGNGMITLEDLKRYEAKWRTPITGEYNGLKVISMPPPSSGGIALISLFQSIEKYPLAKWGFQSEKAIQVMVEAERRVYADRAEHLGDSDFYKVPVAQLVNKAYNVGRMESMSFDKASKSSDIKAGELGGYESDETTHYCVVDKWGNAVSATTTLNNSYGSRTIVGGAGFLLNNEMDDFSVKPGTPNMYGLVGGKANAIEPEKRMLSSMSPTILEKNGKLYMVVGTPGGSTIITSVFQTILNVTEFGMNMQEAVAAPRFHHQWLPDHIDYEPTAISAGVRKALEEKGYIIKERNPYGRVEGILVNKNGTYQAGADTRGDDVAKGY
ncbi:gamma-glutamyltransferase [Myroides marinus]|uniref:Glutathione hydrolase proenzyme n=1 Tax=Myroides marinus TaxID=703342 RepID=A0A164AHI6_9FLAO|nr:gamma-glutamyltransferase [Myroides marinus]KUF40392.1 gamma-glutamyltranspeptidase [Myroides marinus]KZE83867.1 gamma-glutamyltranspeptidase [Myroides marinus]MDM1348728.1 gamma-glutamyltransferase [Myroides marinus]MDM1352340.1 gamma-glutamyltransferase [Myroides marinus]MDM1359553.1 gamma-glutamyltransferase [Myroides marinus]